MLEQELLEDLEQFLLLNYRPEGAKIKDFEDNQKASSGLSGGAFLPPGVSAAVFGTDFLKGIEHLASKLEMSFSDKLMWWIKKQKRKPADVYGAVGISKGLFAKIRNNSQYHPTKETVLAFVVALHLSTEDAADLLRRAGYALSPSSLGDMIVAYFLNAKRYNIDEVNEALYTHDCKTLTNWRDCK